MRYETYTKKFFVVTLSESPSLSLPHCCQRKLSNISIWACLSIINILQWLIIICIICPLSTFVAICPGPLILGVS